MAEPRQRAQVRSVHHCIAHGYVEWGFILGEQIKETHKLWDFVNSGLTCMRFNWIVARKLHYAIEVIAISLPGGLWRGFVSIGTQRARTLHNHEVKTSVVMRGAVPRSTHKGSVRLSGSEWKDYMNERRNMLLSNRRRVPSRLQFVCGRMEPVPNSLVCDSAIVARRGVFPRVVMTYIYRPGVW